MPEQAYDLAIVGAGQDVRLPSGDFINNLVTSNFRYSFNTTTFFTI